MPVIKYIIADDHLIFRNGLRLALEDEQLACIGEAGNGVELLDLIARQQPDLAIIDLQMPEMDGLSATRIIQQHYPGVHIIILSMHDDEHYLLQLMEEGAGSYLLKNVDPDELKTAIRSVVETGYYFNNKLSHAMLCKMVSQQKITPKFNEVVTFSEREKEILKMICNELTNHEISRQLYLSPRTVEGIRAKLLEKIGVRNTAGLVMYAVKAGLAPD